jgi:hypothetical protein
MERDITSLFVQWKERTDRKPLIVRGARQTGKSYSITDFGKTHFKGQTHIINFEKRPDYSKIFDLNYDITRIIPELEVLLNSRIIAGEDLLFFDEIQACPKAIVALRYFYEQFPALHIIAAGSLLEFALGDISFPVGRVHLVNMNSMTFREFLMATGKSLAAEVISEEPKALSETIHSMLTEELKKYFFIGGMPECVKTYVETNSMQSVIEIQTDLIETFRQDFSKYAGRADKSCLNSVLSNVPQNIGQQIKYSTLADGFANPTIKKAFELLETARLISRVKATSPAGLPLGAGSSDKKFKAIMLDIGLLSSLSGLSYPTEYMKTDLLAIFRGALAEQFVGQEIRAVSNNGLYYWSREARNSNAETDYLIEKQGKIIPIEVKSGSSGRLKSLHLLLDTFKNIENAFVFSDARYGHLPEQKITFVPLYFASAAVKNTKN